MVMSYLATALSCLATTAWNLGDALSAIQETIGNYAKVIVGIVGIVMVIVGVYQIAKNLISHGRGQTNWIVTFALIIIGGALMLSSSWDMIRSIATGGKNTINDLGQGNADDSTFQEPTLLLDGDYLVTFDE